MRVRPVGTTAALLELDDAGSVAAWHAAVLALAASGALPPPVDVVPGARTVLVDGVGHEVVARSLAAAPPPGRAAAVAGALVEVPVTYDGEDLPEVARLWGTTEQEVIARHTAAEFRVAFCGFAPGFPYLLGLDREVPRRSSPRTSVPAGSVALAGRYCGIYPTASPGGWQLLGRTGVRLFDADRDPPALLPPGTRVRFVDAPGQAPAADEKRPMQEPSERVLTVLRAGPLSTVQDHGRPGQAHVGVPRSGVLDPPAARLANRLVGNPEDEAVLETTLAGVALRASSATTVAVTGAGGPVAVDGRPAPWGVPVPLGAGAVLDVGAATSGVRAYVAVAGGFRVRPVLGSRSTDTLSGLGPPPLAAGDVLPVGEAGAPPPVLDFSLVRAAAEVVLRVTPGPRADWFGPAGVGALLGGRYTVSPSSNRIGARLAGRPVPREVQGELDSEGVVLGAVQVPPDGQPVVFLADHPTTGGYPVIAVVDPRDLPALAQARPGTPVLFSRTRSHEES